MKTKTWFAALLTITSLVGLPSAASAGPAPQQQFLLNSAEGTTTTSVTATGVLNSVGEDITLDAAFKARRHGRFTVTSHEQFVFPAGALSVTLHVKGRETGDPAKCTSISTGSGTYDVTGGTQNFLAARGQGRFTFDSATVNQRDEHGECLDDDNVGVFFAKLHGT